MSIHFNENSCGALSTPCLTNWGGGRRAYHLVFHGIIATQKFAFGEKVLEVLFVKKVFFQQC